MEYLFGDAFIITAAAFGIGIWLTAKQLYNVSITQGAGLVALAWVIEQFCCGELFKKAFIKRKSP